MFILPDKVLILLPRLMENKKSVSFNLMTVNLMTDLMSPVVGI